ncbi:MAG: bifunctional riboflavin kinase/FAD synthetase [Bacteroidetes bacterium]|nr:bifunctional riboflavin kinase/FAD synthetase [Bacteroidota bacterium]
MQVYHSLDEIPHFKGLVLTQGTFDGVHLGHVKVLENVVNEAQNTGMDSMLLTFFPHPRLVLYPDDNDLRMLCSMDEKIRQVEACGINHMLILPFTSEVAALSPMDFVRSVLVDRLKITTMIVGYDHRFGKNREGSFSDLLQYGEIFNFKVKEIPAGEIDHIAVSSTRIRKALLSGDLLQANQLLGRPYTLSGKVIHGRKLGRTLGFPTANIAVEDAYKLIPATGVYAVRAHLPSGIFDGAMNIGFNPTIPGKGFSIEAHLFGFSSDIYEIAIRIEMIAHLRPEHTFDNLEELKIQIARDCEDAKKALTAS